MSEATPAEITPPDDNSLAAEKVRSFPQTPGVYLMKDAAGRVIYVGKAKNLRARAGSYFLKAAAEDQRTARLVQEIRDIDFLEAESEIDALLMEARLIKDILPKFNRDLRDDKTFPYLEIHTREDFPRVRVHPRAADRGGRSFTGRSPIRGRCAGRSRCCRRSSSSAPARWTSARATSVGGGSGRACCTRSTNAPPRATSASPRRSTARTSTGCSSSSKGRSKPLLQRDAAGDGIGGRRS